MGVAAAIAVALHALLIAAGLALFARPRALRSMRVELVRATAPLPKPPPPVQTVERVPEPVRPPRTEPPGRSRPAPAAPHAAPGAPAAARPGAPAPAAQARPLPARPGDWLVREGVGKLSLQLDPAAGGPPPAGAASAAEEAPGQGLVREKSREERLAEEKATVSRKVEGWLSDARARERARVGRDAYWQTLEDALGQGFDPGWDTLDKGPEGAGGSRVRAFLDEWKTAAAAYGKSGNPYGSGPDAPGAPRPLGDEFLSLANEDRGLGSVSLGGGFAQGVVVGAGAAAAGKLWTRKLVALVRVTQREDGSLFGVELLGTSGSPEYDRLALGQARRLGKLKLGPPKQGLETLWAFETEFSQLPPVPIVGCSLDDLIPKDCFYPLQKRARSHVRLQAIY